MMRPQFVLFGDSITEQSFRPSGWGSALADCYSRQADIVLRGYGGYNTRWALLLLDKIFPLQSSKAPLVVTVFFGANDAALLGRSSERQHVPLIEYKENLHQIITHLKNCSDSMLVVLITPPPIDENGRRDYARAIYGENAVELPERTNETTGTYAKSCIEVAIESRVPVIDLWSRMQETVGWQQKYLSDGLHLTPEGNAIVHEELLKILSARGLNFVDMPDDFPHHSIIDGKDPQKAFHGRE
jgi:lysophospholipase L1-like esterase